MSWLLWALAALLTTLSVGLLLHPLLTGDQVVNDRGDPRTVMRLALGHRHESRP